jgi:RNA polymerase sigma-70 factor (ECF subfamily)
MAMDHSFATVMTRLRDGDEEAATEVFGRFVHRLVALASRQFEARFRAKADPEDVVQSVYRSFFRRQGSSPYELADWDGLWALLATITVRKCIARHQYWRAARRDIAREHDPSAETSAGSWWEAVDREPTPDHAAVLADMLEQLVRQFGPRERAIAELTLQGYTHLEIAEHCDCSERTVARVIRRIRGWLAKIDAAGARD